MLSATGWVPRGYAAEFPEKYELDDDEMERITSMAKLQIGDVEEDEEVTTKAPNALKTDIEVDDDLKEYDLENYDNDDDSEGEDITMIPGLSGTDAKYHQGEDGQDPYLTLPTEEEINEDRKESQVYPTDNLVLATRTEDEISYLDVYVYDDGAGNIDANGIQDADPEVSKGYMRESSLYVHHDLMLPAFPLCVEWINFRPGAENSDENIGNFAAIGSFDPQIEVWNLDSIDKAFPDLILGEPEPNSAPSVKKSKNKKKKKSQHVKTHHTDAILSLSHNKTHRNVLASTSADHTVKLWDLNTGVAVRSFDSIHAKKTVSSSQWHPSEESILLTGGYDGTCGITDVRISDESEMTKSYKISSTEEIENVKWGVKPEIIYCGTDSGNVYSFDIRRPEQPLWTLHAHDAAISSLDVNYFVPGLISTAAMGEKVVKFWKEGEKGPSMILSRDFGVGNVLSTSFANDIEVAGNIVIGGVNDGLKMWDAFNNRSIRHSFKDELKGVQARAREESKKYGKFSRIARKYQDDSTRDAVISIEDGSDDSEGEEEPEEED